MTPNLPTDAIEPGDAAEVAALLGVSVPTVRRRGSDPEDTFPKPFKIGKRLVRWDLREVRAFRASRPRAVRQSAA